MTSSTDTPVSGSKPLSLVTGLLAAIGRPVLGGLARLGRFSRFAADTISHLVRPPFYGREFLAACIQIGWLSLPVVGMTAFFTGGALALRNSRSVAGPVELLPSSGALTLSPTPPPAKAVRAPQVPQT